MVEDIESRLNKNRKLQSAKYFAASDTLRKNKKNEVDSGNADTSTTKLTSNGGDGGGDKVEEKVGLTLTTASRTSAAGRHSLQL